MAEKKKVRLCIDIETKAHRLLKIYSATNDRYMGEVLSYLIFQYINSLPSTEPEDETE